MNYKFALIIFLLAMPAAFSETTGNISFNNTAYAPRNITVTSGLFAYTVSNTSAGCFGYASFYDFDTSGTYTTSFGLCNVTATTSCIHDVTSAASDFYVVSNGDSFCTGGNSNTTYYMCTTGNWSGALNCTSGTICRAGIATITSNSCPTSTTSSSSTTTSSSSSTSTNTTTTPNNSLSVSLSVTSLRIYQGNSSSIIVTVKNTGRNSLSSIILSASGISASWYSSAPSSLQLSSGNSSTFNFTLTVPQSAGIGDYSAILTASASDGTSDSETMFLTVIPTEAGVSIINQTYANYASVLSELKAELAGMSDKGNISSTLASAESKLNEAAIAIGQKDYVRANSLLASANDLLTTAEQQLAQVRAAAPAPADSTILVVAVVVIAVVIAALVIYLMWPSSKERKTLTLLKRFREGK